jgi:hypothetical protein
LSRKTILSSYQNNQSTIRFEKNARKSCVPNSRHIHIRYFVIKDRIISSGITVLHCPTEQILAGDFDQIAKNAAKVMANVRPVGPFVRKPTKY